MTSRSGMERKFKYSIERQRSMACGKRWRGPHWTPEPTEHWMDRWFIHSFVLETYIEPLQETTTQRCSQPSHGQRRRTSERFKIRKGGHSARNAAHIIPFDGSTTEKAICSIIAI